MSHLSSVDILELVDRYQFLLKEYIKLTSELIPVMDKFGKVRKELQLIVLELKERGKDIEDPEELKSFFEEKLKEVNNKCQEE